MPIKTNIVATLGPPSWDLPVITTLARTLPRNGNVASARYWVRQQRWPLHRFPAGRSGNAS